MAILLIGLVLVMAIPIVGCTQSEPKPFPPPEGYSSWDEYHERNQAQAETPSPTPEFTIPPGHQEYVVDIQFTSDDYNKISWSAGVIELADGRTQSINAGSLTLTATHYLYCIWGNPTLQNSTSYSDAVGEDKIMVNEVSIGSTPDDWIIPSAIQGFSN